MRRVVLSLLVVCGLVCAAEPMTNEIIIKLVQAGVPTETIVKTIQSADSFHFGTLPGDLMQLQQQHVPEEIIRALSARINWPGTAPLIVVHAPLTEAPAEATKPTQKKKESTAGETEGYLYKGAREIEFAGSGFISHSSASQSMGLVAATGGYFLSRGHQIGGGMTGMFSSGAHDVFVSGNYRYFVRTGDAKLFPFFGGGAGVNVAHLSGTGTGHNLLGKAEFGVRYFTVRHVAIDLAYDLQYVHVGGADFAASTYSAISVGFAHVF